jgi:hypothetical protein
MKINALLIILFLCTSNLANSTDFPGNWWKYVPRDQARSWEILPQDAKDGEVILSKRTELGIFSNLSYSIFIFQNIKYSSIEGLWQSMKYPDRSDLSDPRHRIISWEYTRSEVRELFGWDSKKAGDMANTIMKKNNIKWVSHNQERFDYKDLKNGSIKHYEIIYGAIREKIFQNQSIKNLLLQTKCLKLMPDHRIKELSPPSYKYHEILMKIRSILQKEDNQNCLRKNYK